MWREIQGRRGPGSSSIARETAIQNVLLSILTSFNPQLPSGAAKKISGFITALLVMDCCMELDRMAGSSPAHCVTLREEEKHLRRKNFNPNDQLPGIFSELAEHGKKWPCQFCINVAHTVLRKKEGCTCPERMNGLLSLQGSDFEATLFELSSDLNFEQYPMTSIRQCKLEAGGGLRIKTFVEEFWKMAEKLPRYYREPLGAETRLQKRICNSFIALQTIIRLMDLDEERYRRRHEHVSNFLFLNKTLLLSKFPTRSVRFLKAAGFGRLCPFLNLCYESVDVEGSKA